MRRGVWLVIFGVAWAAVGVASARADGPGTTTTATTTTATTTTTTATTPSYTPIGESNLPAGCVGAGAAAVVLAGPYVLALGSPASDLGPSTYSPSSSPVLTFDSSTASGSTCATAGVTLNSVSLFDGAISATTVQATNGHGTATGLEIDGAAVAAGAGQTVAVEGWGQVTLGATIDRVTAPLVVRLLKAHDSLPAGTVVAVAFAASARPVEKPKPKHHGQAKTRRHGATRATHASARSSGTHHSTARRNRRSEGSKPAPKPNRSQEFWSHFSFPAGSAFAADAQDSVVSIAMKYLGVPYLWGGANPKTGFDCSGLVQYVFAKLGVSLPHYAAAQWHAPDSVWVAPNHLEPGDLVFFTGSDGTRKEPGHVGIYVGDGDLIDAPHTGSFVRVDSFSERWFARKYVGARRIVASLDAAGHARSAKARHLLNETTQAASAAAILTGFSPPIAKGQVGGPGLAAAGIPVGGTAGHTSMVQAWTLVGLAGVLLLLLSGGAFGFRRRLRRTPEAGE
jgi:peptidoglycan DL-endopeptidase CwlO